MNTNNLFLITFNVEKGDERFPWQEKITSFVLEAPNKESAQIQADKAKNNVLGEHKSFYQDPVLDDDDTIIISVTPINDWLANSIKQGVNAMNWKPEHDFEVGDKVSWTDPDQSEDCSGDGIITEIHGDIFRVLKDDGALVDAFAEELAKLSIKL